MKSFKEVMKLMGITRGTLRNYTDKKLTKASQTSSGYYEYDEKAIETVMVIEIFREIGYKESVIEKMLHFENARMMRELKNAREQLIQKKKRLNGMINYITMLECGMDIPIEELKIVDDVDSEELYREKSFRDSLKNSIDELSEVKIAWNEVEKEIPKMALLLIMIGMHWKKEPSDEKIQKAVRRVYQYGREMFETAIERENLDIRSFKEDAMLRMITSIICKLMDVPKFVQDFNKKMGGDAVGFIKESIRVYLAGMEKEFIFQEAWVDGQPNDNE